MFDSGLGVVLQAISPNVVDRERQAAFKASLLYIVSSKPGMVTQWDFTEAGENKRKNIYDCSIRKSLKVSLYTCQKNRGSEFIILSFS